MDRMLQVTIPIIVKGEPKGVKQQGGILEFIRREIVIEVLPADIPEHIDVDVTEINTIREAVTITKFPQIDSLKRELMRVGAFGALMSGSGSSVFGVFNSRSQAKKAFDQLQRESEYQAFLVRTLD